MHGYDWEALRQQYKPLLKYVAHRSDLNFVIGEMISELTVQHAYIDPIDLDDLERRRVEMLAEIFCLPRFIPGAKGILDILAHRQLVQAKQEIEIFRQRRAGSR